MNPTNPYIGSTYTVLPDGMMDQAISSAEVSHVIKAIKTTDLLDQMVLLGI